MMRLPSWCHPNEVLFVNPRTCGINKNGGPRYKVDAGGRRTDEIDNELVEHVDLVLANKLPPGALHISADECQKRAILVPTYYDPRWDKEFEDLLQSHGLQAVSLGELEKNHIISVMGGHGSPSNDQRIGDIPYIKVSDIRNLRINFNPTNLIPRLLAEKFWGGKHSGLYPWDLITPNRASSNIGEFAMLLPGEEEVVLTKEVFVIRVTEDLKDGWDPFYLMWAFCLSAVRRQWRRVTFMQTNREDVGNRYREVRVPAPKDPDWARMVSEPFRAYFTGLAGERSKFFVKIEHSGFRFIPNLRALIVPHDESDNTVTELGEASSTPIGN